MNRRHGEGGHRSRAQRSINLRGAIESRCVRVPSISRFGCKRAMPKPILTALRLDELFCFDNARQPALRALVESSCAVFMDLRGLTKTNAAALNSCS